MELAHLNAGTSVLDEMIPTGSGQLRELAAHGLHSNHLLSSISFRLGRLSRLVAFVAGSNQLMVTIPFELGDCTLLPGLLDVGSSQLTSTVPNEFASLTLPKGIVVSDNNISRTMVNLFGNDSLLEV